MREAGHSDANGDWTMKTAALVVGVVIACLGITQAIVNHTLAPIWQTGWIPAVLVGVVLPRRADRCASRWPLRSRS